MALTSIGKDFVTKGGIVVEGTGTVTSSTAQTGALQVNGGAAIAANLIVGTTASVYGPTTLYGSLTANQPVTVNSSLDVTGQTTLSAATATIFSATSVTVTGQSTFAGVDATALTATGVTVNGNESITGTLAVTGQSTFGAVTATILSATSVVVTGNETVGGTLNVTGQSTLGPLTAGIITGTNLVISNTADVSGIATFSQGSNPTGAANGTGALQVTNGGGAAIAGQLWVGGTTYLAGDLYVDGTQFVVNNQNIATGDKTLTLSSGSTSAALAAGSGIQIGNTVTSSAYATFLYDGGTAPGYWYTANGLKVNATTGASSTNSGALQVGGSIGVAGGAFLGGAVTASNFIGYFGSPGAGAIGSGSNLYGGVASGLGQLVYQSNANVTAFVSSGTNGQLLYLVGGIPVWTSPSGLSAGSASTSTNLAGGLANQIPYQTSPGQTIFNAGLVYNGTTFTTTNIQVTSNNNATAATGNSGALMVTGGAGISRDLWVGGNINVNGSIFLKGVGLDTISGTTGTFVNVAVTGTGYALTVPNGSVSIGNNLTATTAVITSENASTSSITSNALYVAGGVGIAKTLTVGSDTWITGNLTVVGNITGTNVVINNLTGTNAQFYGDATGNGALYAGVLGYTPFDQTMFQATGNYNGYMEVNVQNINTDTKASGDVVVSADNASLAGAYIDMGITNSNWDGTQPNSLGQILGPNDGYVMVGQNASPGVGDLVFGTTTTGTNVKFVVAATSATVLANQLAMSVGPANSIASSTNTGVLVVYGGAGISGSMYVGGTVTATNAVFNGTTNASSTNTGALQVAGGAGIGLGLVVGGTVTATNEVILGTTNATNTTSGALQVAGGVGIGLNVNAGGSVTAGAGVYSVGAYTGSYSDGIVVDYVTGNGRVSVGPSDNLTFYSGGPATTSTLVLNANGVVSVPSTLNANATNTGALQVSGGAGIAGSLYVGGVVTATTFIGNLTGKASTAGVADSATTATNLAGGATGGIPYQLSPGLTSFIPIGVTPGYVLISNGTTATWANPASGTVNNAITATNVGGFAATQVLYQYTPGITTASAGFTYNIGSAQLVASNLIVTGITTSSGQLVANSGAITNGTGSGALVVAGGAGISGSVNVGGTVYAGLQSAATGVPIYTFSGGNTAFATYTSPVLAGSGQATLDSWSTSSYRTARYVVQIVDSGKIHVTEMTVFTDWTNVYMNQYGISTNQGELGVFDANLTSVAGAVTLTFIPTAASAMTIKVSRLGITP